jgi:hypothetical protein
LAPAAQHLEEKGPSLALRTPQAIHDVSNKSPTLLPEEWLWRLLVMAESTIFGMPVPFAKINGLARCNSTRATA